MEPRVGGPGRGVSSGARSCSIPLRGVRGRQLADVPARRDKLQNPFRRCLTVQSEGGTQKPTRSGAPPSEGESQSEEHPDPKDRAKARIHGEGPSGSLAGEGVPGWENHRDITGSGGTDQPRSCRARAGASAPPTGTVTERQRLGRPGRTRKKTPRTDSNGTARRSGRTDRDSPVVPSMRRRLVLPSEHR